MNIRKVFAFLKAAVLLQLSVFAVSCVENAGADEQPVQLAVKIKNETVGPEAGKQFVTITGAETWRLSLSGMKGDTPWAVLSNWEGDTFQKMTNEDALGKPVTLSWSENNLFQDRTVTINVSDGETSFSVYLTQLCSQNGGPSNEDEGEETGVLRSEPVPVWLELPATRKGDGRYFFTHDMTLGAASFRNYSLYHSEEDLVAHWVAYPLNAWTIGTGDRSDKWGLDPKIPREYQAVLTSRGFGTGYDRGHQLPSADRLTPGANEMTFYGSNMTPQQSSFNQQIWANIEGKVRTWSRQFDTLYVVTGCYTRGATEYREDNDGKHITVPVGYYKAFLGFKKNGGDTGVAGGSGTYKGTYTAAAIYLKHQSYPNNQTTITNNTMTVRELEGIVGENFFPNLVMILGSDGAETVETNLDSVWK